MARPRVARPFPDAPPAVSKARAARYLLELADCGRHLFELDVWVPPKPSQRQELIYGIRLTAHQALSDVLDELECEAVERSSSDPGKAVA